MKPIICVDLNGALIKQRPFDIAHKEWFRIMSELIRDYSINEFAFKEDYFKDVQEIMKKYLGNVDIKTRNAFARNIYSMVVIESVKKWDLVEDFAEYLNNIKKRFIVALITSAPTLAVKGILEKIECKDLFDIVLASPMEEVPGKRELLEIFIKKHGRPLFYIGAGDEAINAFKDAGVKTIVVNWVVTGKNKGNFEANNIQELDKIIQRFIL
ncbi:MAG: HAD family hydrolase [Candidatus Woesearchaeota archaeon]